jgi:hypothetical protein
MTRLALLLVGAVLVGAYVLAMVGSSVAQAWWTATGIGG